MATPISREEFALLQELIENGFEGVHSRLDKVNGRLDRADEFRFDATAAIAKLEERTGGVETQSEHAHRNAKGGIVMGIIAIALGALKLLLQ